MLKASALYIVIVIALVIAILCSSLIVVAYFYKLQYQRTARYDQLQINVGSGVSLLLTDQDDSYANEKTFSLFNGDADSISLKKSPWGIYDVAISKAFIQKDTMYKVFTIANNIDSAKWAALYLVDEDRPLSVSGKTSIRGNVYISKAGIKEAYVDNKSYQGDKRLIIGKKYNSEKNLPELTTGRLNQFEQYLNQPTNTDSSLLKLDSLQNSFLLPTRIASFGKDVKTIQNIKLSGNIILISDTALIIDNSALFDNIIVFARSITVKSGFHGNCQLFATDSISIAHDCMFNYPSCLGVLRFNSAIVSIPEKINIGENTQLTGLIFTYEKKKNNNLQPLIDLGKKVSITGQIYSQGIVGLKDGIGINGSMFTSRFLYQSTFTRYENYIINTTIDANKLSPYYLTSDLVPVAGKRKKIMQWLDAN